MRLFLFSASVLYLLGLKLTSKIDIQPFFYQKPAHIETTTVPASKHEIQQLEVKPVLNKKDTLTTPEYKSGQLTSPSVKHSEK